MRKAPGIVAVTLAAVFIALLAPSAIVSAVHAQTEAKADPAKESTDSAHHAPAKAKSKPDPLGFDPDLAVFTFIVFVLLFGFLSYFAWPQISAALVERENKIAAQLAAAEAKHQEAKKLFAEHEAKLAAAAGEVRELLEEARRDAEVTKGRIVAEARKAGEDEKARAVREIERAKDGAIQELATASVNVAIDLARKVIQQKITPDEHTAVVREALSKLASQPSKN